MDEKNKDGIVVVYLICLILWIFSIIEFFLVLLGGKGAPVIVLIILICLLWYPIYKLHKKIKLYNKLEKEKQEEAEKQKNEKRRLYEELLQSRRDLLQSRRDVVTKNYMDFFQEYGCIDVPSEFHSEVFCVGEGILLIAQTRDSYLKQHEKEIDSMEAFACQPITYKAVPIQSIQFFTKEGDIQYTTDISGGGGGGSSIGGAIVGGLIAGETGAVIGSRKKTAPIRTSTQVHDTRKTIIRYYVEGKIEMLTYPGFEVYDFLAKNIPEKDYATMRLQTTEPRGERSTVSNIKEKLESLQELFRDGLIDEQEYQDKKKELLQQM